MMSNLGKETFNVSGDHHEKISVNVLIGIQYIIKLAIDENAQLQKSYLL